MAPSQHSILQSLNISHIFPNCSQKRLGWHNQLINLSLLRTDWKTHSTKWCLCLWCCASGAFDRTASCGSKPGSKWSKPCTTGWWVCVWLLDNEPLSLEYMVPSSFFIYYKMFFRHILEDNFFRFNNFLFHVIFFRPSCIEIFTFDPCFRFSFYNICLCLN